MGLRKLLFGCPLVFLCAISVRADSMASNDPKIIVGRGSDATPITSLNFSLPVNSSGGGFFDFENASGQDWVGLILTVTFPNAADAKAAAVSCTTDIFSNCLNSRHGTTLTITFGGGGMIVPCLTSICPADSEFIVDLNDADTLTHHGNPGGKGGWRNDLIQVQALTTPEPATYSLLLLGLIAIPLSRKRA
jgi:PEP-CTERM motif